MATEKPLFTTTLPASTTLVAADLFRLIKRSTAGEAIRAGSGDKPLGVLLEEPSSGKEVLIGVAGRFKVEAGSTMPIDALITSSTIARAVAISTGTYPVGRTLEAATAAGDHISCFVNTLSVQLHQ